MSNPDFVKGASGPDPYASGLGIAAPYLGGASASANATGGSGTAGTSFPTTPNNGDEFVYYADTTNGIFWKFRYYTASTYWAFVGGDPLLSEVLTSETTTSAGYADLATVGPSVVLPFAGDFLIRWGCQSSNSAAGNGNLATVTGGGIAASDNWTVASQGQNITSVTRSKVFTGITASATMKLQYRTGAGTATFAQRFIEITPVKK